MKKIIQIIITCVISIAVVGAFAYYLGYTMGQETGINQGYEQGYADAEKIMENAQEQIISKTTKNAEIDPLENLPSANPMDNVNINPFESGYENPFD